VKATFSLLLFVAFFSNVSTADPREKRLSTPLCYAAVISQITSRLDGEDPREVGTALSYSNGVMGTSYSYLPEISERSRVGDPVNLCLVAEYVGCPKGDDRGKTFSGKNLRTGESWELSESQHICGGA
jgi:hypothetical protein